MKFLSLIIALTIACAGFDPFYYGEDSREDKGLNLYGLMKEHANINGKWHKAHATFEAQNTSFKILKIQNPCVFLQEIPTQAQHTICLKQSKLLRN